MNYTWKPDEFMEYLRKLGKSQSTIDSSIQGMKNFFIQHEVITEGTAYEWKEWLRDNKAPKTCNIRVNAFNQYLKFMGEKEFRLHGVKIQQKPFLENVISAADYEFLKKQLKKDGDSKGLLVIWALGSTGARVSELIKFKSEHIKAGHFDIYGKGKKYRRIYIPKTFKTFAEEYIAENNISGYLFRNKNSQKNCSGANIRHIILKLSEKYHIDRAVMHPHSFRHMFAKRFLEKRNDITFLADLMGHEELETTRIYLRKTAAEQRTIVDKVIDW